jgi:hypothetical protein
MCYLKPPYRLALSTTASAQWTLVCDFRRVVSRRQRLMVSNGRGPASAAQWPHWTLRRFHSQSALSWYWLCRQCDVLACRWRRFCTEARHGKDGTVAQVTIKGTPVPLGWRRLAVDTIAAMVVWQEPLPRPAPIAMLGGRFIVVGPALQVYSRVPLLASLGCLRRTQWDQTRTIPSGNLSCSSGLA